MPERKLPTREEVQSWLHDRRNWGRWANGAGAYNLITAEKRKAAAGLVKSGRAVSLSRALPVAPAANNPEPAQHYTKTHGSLGEAGGAAVDYLGIFQHGFTVTHLDALCHTWDEDGMWEGRDPAKELTFDGASHGAVDNWRDGFMTRGVLLDVPKHRGTPYVTQDAPVHGWELEEILEEEGLTIGPGDAAVVYSGLEAYAQENGPYGADRSRFPGVHASCLPFIRERDIALWVWDMTEMVPNGYGLPWSIHGILYSYGVALVDNALLAPLAQACAQEGRYEFLLTVNPLVVVGGTGSPVNPVAVL